MLAGELQALAERFEKPHERYRDRGSLLSAIRIELPLKAGNLLLRALDIGILTGLDGSEPEWDLRRSVSLDEKEFTDWRDRERHHDQLIIDSWYACIRWCLARRYGDRFEAAWRDHFKEVDRHKDGLTGLLAWVDAAPDPVWPTAGAMSRELSEANLMARAEVQASACRLLAYLLREVGQDMLEVDSDVQGIRSAKPKRARTAPEEAEASAKRLFHKLWKLDNATEWGRLIGKELGRGQVDARTIKKLPSWGKAKSLRDGSTSLKKRLRPHGLTEAMIDALVDPKSHQINHDELRLDDQQRVSLESDVELQEDLRQHYAKLNELSFRQYPGAEPT